MIKEADMVIVMEASHKDKILGKYPESSNKVFLLSRFGNEKGIERDIADPYGASVFYYRTAFREISSYINGLLNFLKGLPS
jgi:protein-tyrosine-phosphatase